MSSSNTSSQSRYHPYQSSSPYHHTSSSSSFSSSSSSSSAQANRSNSRRDTTTAPQRTPPPASSSPPPPLSTAVTPTGNTTNIRPIEQHQLRKQEKHDDTFYNINWYFAPGTLSQQLPSVQLDRCTLQQDMDYRRNTCAFILESGLKLGSPQLTIATAMVFFHRFFAIHSFRKYDRYLVAATCLFLAGKSDDTFRKVRDIIFATEKIKHRNILKQQRQMKQEKAADEGNTPPPEFNEEKVDYSSLATVNVESPEHEALKQQIFQMERILLQTLGFDLKVEHPYKNLINLVKAIGGDKSLMQASWNFVNDSFRTALCLQFKPQEVSAAAVYLASRLMKHELPVGDETNTEQRPWWELFKTTPQRCKAMAYEILDMYVRMGGPPKQKFQHLKMKLQQEIAEENPPAELQTQMKSTIWRNGENDMTAKSTKNSGMDHQPKPPQEAKI